MTQLATPRAKRLGQQFYTTRYARQGDPSHDPYINQATYAAPEGGLCGTAQIESWAELMPLLSLAGPKGCLSPPDDLPVHRAIQGMSLGLARCRDELDLLAHLRLRR